MSRKMKNTFDVYKPCLKSDGIPTCRLKAQKQKELMRKLKDDLRVAQSLHRTYRKAAVGALGELKLQVQTLQEELDEVKAEALDQRNDRAEVVGELQKRLQKRAVPEGWELVTVRKEGWRYTVSRMAIADLWRWTVHLPSGNQVYGNEKTMATAVAAAEAVKIPKAKKAKRK